MEGYTKMALMLAISFFIMYGVMFLNVDEFSHVYLSLTRVYMVLLMVSPMTLLMLILMSKMFPDKRINLIVGITSVVVFAVALVFLRHQTFISDTQYMRAMIPHHSSAIMTSKNASINDSEVHRLSLDIINSQQKEIEQMKSILQRTK